MEMPRKPNETEPSAAIPTRFTEAELARMERVRAFLGLPTRSALIRQAVLQRLDEVEKMKIVEVRDVTVDEAERLIEAYMRAHPGTRYISDVADEVGIGLKVAFEAAQRLLDRGRLLAQGE